MQTVMRALLVILLLGGITATGRPARPGYTVVGLVTRDHAPIIPNHINNSGVVAGWSLRRGRARAAIWQRGVGTELTGLPGPESHAMHVSETGEVVGDAGARAFAWSAGTVTLLPGLGGGISVARCVNRSGDVVGQVRLGEALRRPVFWHDGEITDLGQGGDDTGDVAYINEPGQMVGWTGGPPGTRWRRCGRPIMWSTWASCPSASALSPHA